MLYLIISFLRSSSGSSSSSERFASLSSLRPAGWNLKGKSQDVEVLDLALGQEHLEGEVETEK